MSLNIPALPPELLSSVGALARAAYLFRGVMLQTLQGATLDVVLDERKEALRLADRVVNQWADYFNVGADAGDEGSDGMRR